MNNSILLRRVLPVLLVVGVAAGLYFWKTQAKPVAVVLKSVDRGKVEATVVNTRAGTVEACQRTKLSTIMGGRIEFLGVKEGDKVEAGTPLLRLESFEMVKELADMAYRDGELAIREGQLRGRLGAIKTVMPLAERTARESTSTVARFDTVSAKGLISALSKGDALRGSLAASERVADLSSQQEATEIELGLVTRARQVSGGAMKQLGSIYDDGNVRATAAGEVGVKVPMPGQVVSFGDELMQINGGKAYILAYLPDQYLFGVEAGMAVNVSGSGKSVRGRVESVLGVADALPAEFQNMFRPRDRSRLVRVVLDDPQPFAVSQKVRVSGCALGLCWAR